jgi:hypothetical protein
MTSTATLHAPRPESLRRVFEATGIAAGWVGLLFALAAVAAFLLQEAILGRFAPALQAGDPYGVLDDIRIAITHIVVVTYLPTAYVYAQQSAERTWLQLGPVLEGDVRLLLRRTTAERVAMDACAVAGVVASLLISVTGPGVNVSYWPSSWTPETSWHRVCALLMGFWIGRLLALIVVDSLRLSREAGSLRELDLLDLEGVAPFTHYGLTNVLLMMGFAAGYALFLVDTAYLPIFGLNLGLAALAGGMALVLPVLGARRAIQEQKRRELRWCRDRIRAARRALERGGADAARPPRLDELVAWEARVEGVPDWPFDASTLARFGLYLLIPLLSWSGGALVERLIDALLD